MFDHFKGWYEKAILTRDSRVADPYLSSLFTRQELRSFPPIVGFGLPRKGIRPLATIGLNPSPKEIGQPIPNVIEVDRQWCFQSEYFSRSPYRAWFDLAQKSIAPSGFSYGGIYGGDATACHVDLSPVITMPLDRAFGHVSKEEKERILSCLNEDCQQFLLPALGVLKTKHDLKYVLVFGFCPGSPSKGSATFRRAWSKSPVFHVTDEETVGDVILRRGYLDKKFCDGNLEWAILREVRWVFLSKGPSYSGLESRIVQVGDALGRLGWLS